MTRLSGQKINENVNQITYEAPSQKRERERERLPMKP
jgi:hypothetical protein